MNDAHDEKRPYGHINMKVPLDQYHEVKGFAKSRHQTMTGYLMCLHRAELDRAKAEKDRVSGVQHR